MGSDQWPQRAFRRYRASGSSDDIRTAGVTKYFYQTVDASDCVASPATARTDLLCALQDARGKITRFNYDAWDRLTRVVNPLKTTYVYYGDLSAQRGNLQSITTPRSLPATTTTTFDYDPYGNISRVTDGNNQTTTSVYDAMNRLTSVTDAQQPTAETTAYFYRPAGGKDQCSWSLINRAPGVIEDLAGARSSPPTVRSKNRVYGY